LRVSGETLDFLKERIEAHILRPRLRRRSSTTGLQKKGQSAGCFTRPAEIRSEVEAGGRPGWLFGFDWEILKLPFHRLHIASPAAAKNPVGSPPTRLVKLIR